MFSEFALSNNGKEIIMIRNSLDKGKMLWKQSIARVETKEPLSSHKWYSAMVNSGCAVVYTSPSLQNLRVAEIMSLADTVFKNNLFHR